MVTILSALYDSFIILYMMDDSGDSRTVGRWASGTAGRCPLAAGDCIPEGGHRRQIIRQSDNQTIRRSDVRLPADWHLLTYVPLTEETEIFRCTRKTPGGKCITSRVKRPIDFIAPSAAIHNLRAKGPSILRIFPYEPSEPLLGAYIFIYFPHICDTIEILRCRNYERNVMSENKIWTREFVGMGLTNFFILCPNTF